MRKIILINLFLALFFGANLLAADAYHAPRTKDFRKEDRYQHLAGLGDGAFGSVFAYKDHAMKVSLIDLESQSTFMNMLEAAVLQSLSHPLLPVAKKIKIHKGARGIYLELHVPKYDKLALARESVLKSVISLLDYLQVNNFAYRDFKKAHIMQHENAPVVIDWGSIDLFSACPSNFIATTTYYRSPELMASQTSDPIANDIWAFAAALLDNTDERNEFLFYGDSKDKVLGRINLFLRTESIREIILNRYKLGELQTVFEGMLQRKETRSTVSDLKNNFNVETNCAPLPNLPVDRADAFKRRELFLAILDVKLKRKLTDKALFDAFGIASSVFNDQYYDLHQMRLLALASVYMSAGFYDDHPKVYKFRQIKDSAFAMDEVLEMIQTILRDSQCKLIFRHTLREFQNEIYGEAFNKMKQDMAIMVLVLLEIDPKTFALPNGEKWSYITALLHKAVDVDTAKKLAELDGLITRNLKAGYRDLDVKVLREILKVRMAEVENTK